MMATLFLVGSILPTDLMHSHWFAVLTTFVAVNTVLYLTLAIIKILPKAYVSDWIDRRNRRSETRSIYPEVDGQPSRP
jgi:hypothetical protein